MFKNVSTGVLIQNLASVQYNPYVNCDSEQLEYICRYMYDLVSSIILVKRNEYVCVTEFERRSKILDTMVQPCSKRSKFEYTGPASTHVVG